MSSSGSQSQTTGQGDARYLKVSEAPLDPRRYGATFDGITDDTVALRNAFNAIPDTGGTIRLAGGRAVTKRILVNAKSNVRVIFDRAELFATASAPDTGAGDAGVVLNFNACTDLDLHNVTINANRGNIPSQASGASNRGVQVAMKLGNSTRVHVNQLRIVESVQDAVSGQNNKQITFTDPILENIGESGIYFSTGSQDIVINGGSFTNTGACGDWGNVVQFRHDCQRITVNGLASQQSYGGIALTEGVTDVVVAGFNGHDMGIPLSINTAGAVNLTNSRIKVIGSLFEASASPRAALNSTVDNFTITGSAFYGGFFQLGGFDTLSDTIVDGFTPGAGSSAVLLKAKSKVTGCTIRNITGRGLEIQGAGASAIGNDFDTLSDIAIRILAAGTGFRQLGNRFTAVTGGPLFDSTTDSLNGLLARPATAATTPGAVAKKAELFDPVTGASLGFIPLYTSIT